MGIAKARPQGASVTLQVAASGQRCRSSARPAHLTALQGHEVVILQSIVRHFLRDEQ